MRYDHESAHLADGRRSLWRVGGDPTGSDYVAVVRQLAPALGAAVGIDEIARCALQAARRLPHVTRAAIALTRGGGRQLQFLSTDADRLGPSLRWCLIDSFDDIPLNRAVRTGVDVYLHSADEVDRLFPMIAERQRSLGTRSMTALSFPSDSAPLGGLLLSFGDEQGFGPDQRALLTSFAAQVAQALQRDRTHRAQVATAEALQRSLMPPRLPEPPGLSLCARYHPGGVTAEVGGDWYDMFDVADGSTAFAVGDVTGKGLQAAVLMGEVRTALRAYALLDCRPSVVLPRLEEFVSARTGADHLVTVIYGYLSPDRSRLTWSVAGHPPPLLVPSTESPVVLDEALGPALGLGSGHWPEAAISLRPDETLFAFTDGLVHGRQVDVFAGIERLRQHFSELPRRRRKPRRLCGEARAAMSGDAGWDDVTMLAVGRVPAGARESVCSLSSEPTAVRTARRFVADELCAWDVEEDAVEAARLCVSELVTNAVLHGGSASELAVEMDDSTVTVVVTDTGGGHDVGTPMAEDVELVGGRGLALVEALTSAWGTERTADGTSVWFELETSAGVPTTPAVSENDHP